MVAMIVCVVALVFHKKVLPGLPASSSGGWVAQAVTSTSMSTGRGWKSTITVSEFTQPCGLVAVTQ